jgi:hypothetical protein
MKAVQIVALDDVEYKAGHQVEAAQTITLGWNGEWRELDLSGANFYALKDAIKVFWDAGHEPGLGLIPGGTRNSKKSRAYFEGMREWADSQGRSAEYTKYESGYRYEPNLRRDYDAYLVEQAKKG